METAWHPDWLPAKLAFAGQLVALHASRLCAYPQAEDVEDIPRADEDEPFTEKEVAQMADEVKQALREAFPGEKGDQQATELEVEIAKTNDLQEKGRMLMDVMEYLQNPPEDNDSSPDDDADPPYPGEEGLQELWAEVTDLCNEEDIDRLEEELKGKSGEEQWAILLDVRDYLLNGDEDEQAAYADWKPTLSELEKMWKEMLKRVPKEEVKEVQEGWKAAGFEEKKRMAWDVRKFLEQQDEDEQDGVNGPSSPSKATAKDKPPAVDDPEMGRSEVRRRSARRGAEYEYGYEYDVPGGKDQDNGEWDDYYSKEVQRSKSGRSPLVIIAGVVLLSSLTVVLTAAATADEEETVTSSAMRLLRMR